MNRRILIGSAAIALAALGCGDVSTEPGRPGTATVSLTTPNADDGGVIISLTGSGFSNLQSASSGYRVYWRLASEREVRAIVIGNIVSGPLFTVGVSDVGGLARITATVVEAASRTDTLRASLAAYAISVSAVAGP